MPTPPAAREDEALSHSCTGDASKQSLPYFYTKSNIEAIEEGLEGNYSIHIAFQYQLKFITKSELC